LYPQVIWIEKTVYATGAPKPVGPYSQAVEAGAFIFVSGQLPIEPETGQIITGGTRAQTARIMENIRAILKASGCDFNDVLQCTVCLASMASFKDFNAEYERYFTKDFPARVTVGAELMQGVLVEISVVACKRRRLP